MTKVDKRLLQNTFIESVTPGIGLAVNSADPANLQISANIATQAEAESGTDTTKLMNPLRVAQAIAKLSPPTDLSAIALELADLKGGRLAFKGGIADAFDDESGVDATASTNEVYDATNDLYRPLAIFSEEKSTVGTSSIITVATYVNRGFVIDNGKTVDGMFIYSDAAYSGRARILRRDSATSFTFLTGAVAEFSHTGDSTWQFFPFAAPVAIPATGDFYGSVYGSGNPSIRGATTTARSVNSSDITGTQTSGWIEAASELTPSIGVRYLEGGNNNMTLISVGYSVTSQQSTARLVLQLNTPLTVTPTTDFDGQVSRDDGVTWTNAPLTLSSTLGDIKTYESDMVSLSAQPAGTTMRWRARTLTNKNIAMSGVVEQWS